ncbi:MAG: IPExxxVDY family protein [Bacteroidales bacterium]|jgi:hypothetical protein|nr:IPExxxVDY family protein [Bacteroidales bacterium]
MAKKIKLTSGSSYDYTTIGIACHMKDYRFAFFVNEQLGFHFKRLEDLISGDEKESRGYSFYIFINPEDRRNYYLVSNYHEEGRLIPSEKGADFFLIVNDILPASRKKEMIVKIQKVPQAIAAYEIPAGKVKNLELIFEEIEMHLL